MRTFRTPWFTKWGIKAPVLTVCCQLPHMLTFLQTMRRCWDYTSAAHLLTNLSGVFWFPEIPNITQGFPFSIKLSFQCAFTVAFSPHQSHIIWTWTETRESVHQTSETLVTTGEAVNIFWWTQYFYEVKQCSYVASRAAYSFTPLVI